jgi:tetratricopeptide (TPR) repeat protein
MGHLILSALALALMAGCAPSGPQALRQGGQLIREGKYPEAVAKLNQAVQLLPDNAQAWNHLGMAYQGAQQLDLAAQAYLQALKLNRQLAAARYNLGCLRLAQNHPVEAVAELTTYTLMQPESAEGWRQLGLAQLQIRQLTMASQSLEQALKLRENQPEAWNGLGMVEVQKGHYRDALNCFTNALHYQSNYGPALLNEGVLYQEAFKNRALAVQKYREYLALRPLQPQAAAVEQLVLKLDPPPATRLAATSNLPPLATLGNRLPPEHPASSTNPPSGTAGAMLPIPVVEGATSTTAIAGATALTQADDKSLTNKIVTRSFGPAIKPAATNERTATPIEPLPVHVAQDLPTNLPPPEAKATTAVPRKPATMPATNTPGPLAAAGTTPTNANPTQANPETSPEKPRVTEVVHLTEPDPLPPGKAATVPAPLLTNTVVAATSSETSPGADEVAAPTISSPPAKQEAGASTAPKVSGWRRINPLTWGRSKTEDTIVTPLTPLTNQAKPTPRVAETPREKSADNSAKTLVVAQVIPPVTNTVQPVERPTILRYPYRTAARPVVGNRQEASAYFSRGLDAHNAGSNTVALAAFQKAAELDPTWFEAHYNAALMAGQTGDLGRALREYEFALAINAESTTARYNFALALAQANYPKDAAQQLELLVTRNLADPRVHLLLGNLYAQQLYEPQKARQQYWKVLDMDPRNPQAPAIRNWLASHP